MPARLPPSTRMPDPLTPTDLVAAEAVSFGAPVQPVVRLRNFSPEEWEDFVCEWAHSLKEKYRAVDRCGGAGDMGRDVIALHHEGAAWTNFQCKRYDHRLHPGDIWLELGKLCYYTKIKEYAVPEKYYFVAPRSVGTALRDLIRAPVRLKQGLLENWAKKCAGEITDSDPTPLDDSMRQYIQAFDFSIIDYIPELTLIEQHAKTPWYVTRFGGGLPPKPQPQAPPQQPAEFENQYIRALLEAYADHLQKQISTLTDLADQDCLEHLTDARVEFYCAESLRTFSRATLPPGAYDHLLNQVHAAAKDELRAPHPNGYARLLAVVKHIRIVPLNGHPLQSRIDPQERGGFCHQLANEKSVRWIK